MQKRYYLAHDCPVCGEKDSQNAWKGARMLSSAWGHDFYCCSDECGKAFAVIWREKIKTKTGRRFLRDLWKKLQSQSNYLLSGEPYPGYNAEEELRFINKSRKAMDKP